MTTAGGIEEDFIKCLAPTFIGDFSLKGRKPLSISLLNGLIFSDETMERYLEDTDLEC